MTLKRKALLIGGQDPSQNLGIMSGIHADIECLSEFLQTPLGGAWQNHEIKILDFSIQDIGVSDLQLSISNLETVDYAIIAYFGHGYTTKDEYGFPQTILEIAPDIHFSAKDLRITKKTLLLLDCCRTMFTEQMIKEASNFSFHAGIVSPQARTLYDRMIEISERGVISIFSTQNNHAASGTHTFTQALVQACQYWGATRKTNELHCLTTKEAFQLALPILHANTPEQHPEYQGGRRMHHFPFAIGL